MWKYTPDLPNLPQTRLHQVEAAKEQTFELIDNKTKRVKVSGWMKRDEKIIINKEVVPWDYTQGQVREFTKFRHLTLLLTFTEKTIIISRLFDLGVNCLFISTTIMKAQPDNPDVFARLADDMQVKELHAVINSDTRSLGVQPFSVQGAFETFNFSDKVDFDKEKYSRVFNLYERNTHPFNIEYNFDVFVEKGDEPLSLVQEQTEDGKYFIAHSSRLGLRSFGHHKYYAFRQLVDVDQESFTNMIVQAGAPMYGQGKYANLHAAGWVEGPGGEKVRFGFEMMSGLSGKPGLSTANKNAFTINGKLHKLPAMDIVEGCNHPNEKGEEHDGDLENLKISTRKPQNPQEAASCTLSFERRHHMGVCVNLVAVILCEMYGPGVITGECTTAGGEGAAPITYKIKELDALLLWD